MFRSSNFYKLLDEATNSHRLDVDWDIIMKINDLIRQNDVSAKDAINAISKKISNANSHTAYYGLVVLESCVKNCGSLVHDEISTKAFMEQFRSIIENCTHDKVKTKALDLIQSWAFAFRNHPKYRAVNDCATIMKANGYKFPVFKESDAMFVADNAPKWEDGNCCHRCRTLFSFMTRKHHCRACGQVFCNECSSHESTIPKYGIEKSVRVCDSCFEKNKNCTSHSGNDSGHSSLQKGKRRPHKSRKSSPSWSKNTLKSGGPLSKAEDLPSEYLNSSLAQQPQTAPKKSEEELKEEEEMQLAMALSQSEAESKQSYRPVSRSKSFSPPATNNKVNQFENEDPELSRYLNRTYWENRANSTTDKYYERDEKHTSIAAGMPNLDASTKRTEENGVDSGPEIDDFITALRGQVEIFVNRMKSNSSRGRSISNDSSVQSLFLNITTMHSQLLKYIQEQDDSRVYYEGLQDKLTQIKDARAALNALREEHRERMRREAELAERQRQLQMAQKLQSMRQKKQEYLQYQRELALQQIRDQERELHMRQEQQKQQYRLGGPYGPHPFMVPSQGVSAFEPVSSMGMNINNLPPTAAPAGQFVPPQFAAPYTPGQNGPPQQPMGPAGPGALMMGQPPQMQPPPANAYAPVNASSPGHLVNAPPSQPGQYPMGQPPVMHPNPHQHQQQPHLKVNAAGQPVPADAQNGHPMMGGPQHAPYMMGPPPGIAPPPTAARLGEPPAHLMSGGGPPAGLQHPGIMRSMVPPSSSPLSSPSSSSEHSLIQHGPQPTPSAPSATSTPLPEEKEEVAELISFD